MKHDLETELSRIDVAIVYRLGIASISDYANSAFTETSD